MHHSPSVAPRFITDHPLTPLQDRDAAKAKPAARTAAPVRAAAPRANGRSRGGNAGQGAALSFGGFGKGPVKLFVGNVRGAL